MEKEPWIPYSWDQKMLRLLSAGVTKRTNLRDEMNPTIGCHTPNAAMIPIWVCEPNTLFGFMGSSRKLFMYTCLHHVHLGFGVDPEKKVY